MSTLLPAGMTDRDSGYYTLPSGIEVKVFELVGSDVNSLVSGSQAREVFYKMLEQGVYVVQNGELTAYNPRNGWIADNFSALIDRRRVTVGDEFVFPIKCSNDKCPHGKPHMDGGSREYMRVFLGEEMPDPGIEAGPNMPASEIPMIENPHRVQKIKWAETRDELMQGLGADKRTGRFLAYMPKLSKARGEDVFMVMRLLRGVKDDSALQQVAKKYKDKKATEALRIKCVGLLSDFANPDSWEISEDVKAPSSSLFERMSFLDIEALQEKYNELEGGVDTDIQGECPLCSSTIHNLDNNNQIPMLSQNFFSRKSAPTGPQPSLNSNKAKVSTPD